MTIVTINQMILRRLA